MKVCESKSIHGKLVNVRSANLSSEAGQVTKAQIICHYYEKVWTLLSAIGSHDGRITSLEEGYEVVEQTYKLNNRWRKGTT